MFDNMKKIKTASTKVPFGAHFVAPISESENTVTVAYFRDSEGKVLLSNGYGVNNVLHREEYYALIGEACEKMEKPKDTTKAGKGAKDVRRKDPDSDVEDGRYVPKNEKAFKKVHKPTFLKRPDEDKPKIDVPKTENPAKRVGSVKGKSSMVESHNPDDLFRWDDILKALYSVQGNEIDNDTIKMIAAKVASKQVRLGEAREDDDRPDFSDAPDDTPFEPEENPTLEIDPGLADKPNPTYSIRKGDSMQIVQSKLSEVSAEEYANTISKLPRGTQVVVLKMGEGGVKARIPGTIDRVVSDNSRLFAHATFGAKEIKFQIGQDPDISYLFQGEDGKYYYIDR